jgi:Cysteine rich repeat
MFRSSLLAALLLLGISTTLAAQQPTEGQRAAIRSAAANPRRPQTRRRADPDPRSVRPRRLGRCRCWPPGEAMFILRTCRADRYRFCADVPPGGGRIIMCLAENAANVSPDCAGVLAAARR